MLLSKAPWLTEADGVTTVHFLVLVVNSGEAC